MVDADIDTVGTSGNVDGNRSIFNMRYMTRNGKDTIRKEGYALGDMMPKKVVPAKKKP
jgi:hypothetical protein